MSISHVGKSNWRKSVYVPINPNKYKGGQQIITRSTWEYRFCRFLDLNESVIEWMSEQPLIPYQNPNTGTVWNYHPDFTIRIKTQDGVKTQMIEIKPKKQTRPPITEGKRKKTVIYEALAWRLNTAKWAAAKSYCDQHGWEFKILTEDDIFVKSFRG
jgi:hypothetical protein